MRAAAHLLQGMLRICGVSRHRPAYRPGRHVVTVEKLTDDLRFATPLFVPPESRSPTTLESDLTIAFRIDLRSSFVHLLVRHDRATAAAILEPAAAG